MAQGPFLGVNVDHVATVRQARRIAEPDPVAAALVAETAGARCITMHLREDRRHILDRDVRLMAQLVKTKLNLEMAATDEMLAIAREIRPAQVCLVPERRQELTTEGGLDLVGNAAHLASFIPQLQDEGIRVSVFLDPEPLQVTMAKELGADIVELHTGRYCEATEFDVVESELGRIAQAARMAEDVGLTVHVGHGLNYRNVLPVACVPQVEELNIGHSIVGHAIFVGFARAVEEMVALLDRAAVLRQR